MLNICVPPLSIHVVPYVAAPFTGAFPAMRSPHALRRRKACGYILECNSLPYHQMEP